MKKIESVSPSVVMRHWQNMENHSELNFRSDIRDPLPKNLVWYIAEVEVGDLEAMYIISSGDWTDVSSGTFRVSEVVPNLALVSDNEDTKRITKDINAKLAHLKTGGVLDGKLIAVTHDDSLTGPFTLIEGNRRSVAFASNRSLIGSQIFVGVSPEIVTYNWAKMAYRNRKI